MIENTGVNFDKNMSGPGRTLDLGEVTRLSSAADRPAIRTTATMSDPRQILPSDVPVARCRAAVVTSSESWRRSSSLYHRQHCFTVVYIETGLTDGNTIPQ